MMRGQRSGRRRQRGKPVQLFNFSEGEHSHFKLINNSHLLVYFREDSSHHCGPDVAAIIDCCLAQGPSYKRVFQLLSEECSHV